MSEPSRNFLVGIFVLASLTVLALMLAWFGEAPSWLGGNEWTLRVGGVRQLRGVEPGNPVRMNGVEIGRVRGLEFADRSRPDAGVVIVVGIQDEFSIPFQSSARVYAPALGFGAGHIDIIFPEGASVPLEKVGEPMIRGEMRDTLTEIIPRETIDSLAEAFVNVGNFAEAATPAAKNLAALLMPPGAPKTDEAPESGPEASLFTAVQKLDELLGNLTELVGDPTVQGDVRLMIGEIRSAIGDLRASVDSFRISTERIAGSFESGVGDITADIDETFASLNSVLERLDSSATNLAVATQKIAEGRGTLGLLVNDPRLYEAAVISLDRFSGAMASLQVILGKFERQGFITVGQAPSGTLRKNIPIPEPQSAGQ